MYFAKRTLFWLIPFFRIKMFQNDSVRFTFGGGMTRIVFRSFWNWNVAQKNASCFSSVCCHSGIVPKECTLTNLDVTFLVTGIIKLTLSIFEWLDRQQFWELSRGVWPFKRKLPDGSVYVGAEQEFTIFIYLFIHSFIHLIHLIILFILCSCFNLGNVGNQELNESSKMQFIVALNSYSYRVIVGGRRIFAEWTLRWSWTRSWETSPQMHNLLSSTYQVLLRKLRIGRTVSFKLQLN